MAQPQGTPNPFKDPSIKNEKGTILSNPSANGTLVSVPLEKKIEPSALENQTSIWAGYEQDVLPPKVHAQWLRNLRYQVFYLYRRLFGIVFIINFGILISVAVNFEKTNSLYIGQIVIGNLFGAILMRQDYVIDAFFVVCTSIPRSWPLFIRRTAARVYHIGGLHSGAGVSGTMWLVLFCVKASIEVARGEGGASGSTLVVTYVVLALLLTILVFVYPALRLKYHDSFEATHRFLGWSTTALVWVQVSHTMLSARRETNTCLRLSVLPMIIVETLPSERPYFTLPPSG
ncbi:hypothetical protein DXG03_001918 [Asterophora parasitica]|uniref:Uncharacterized protein n=1 Tax=Asterophora parasitica TaxID=117018 RepID=A0A9P7G4D5_9AGAR|nr:hypothetical protein DXG03_001918 [Asterophora parasitica]